MLNRKILRDAYENLQPTQAQKDRMLENILSEAPASSSTGRQYSARAHEKERLWPLAAVLALILCSAGVLGALLVREDGPPALSETKQTEQTQQTEYTEPSPVQTAEYSEVFTSTDGTIEFRLSIDEDISAAQMPVLEVVPHTITAEEAKRVAYALFDDAEFYEREPWELYNFSKSEIQEKLDRWSQYADAESLLELYPYRENDTTYQSEVADLVNSFIEEYTEKLETAPEENPHTPCAWTFKKTSEYHTPAEELVGMDLSNENDEISAVLTMNGYPYCYTACNRDKEDFDVNMLSACFYSGVSPNGIDEEIFKARLLRTGEPTEEQLAAVKEKAETMLEQMDMGQWLVDECYVETYEAGTFTEYTIHVNAVPILNGTPALRVPQYTALRNPEGTESYYYYTDVEFEFSANGDLILFAMYSPIDIVNTVEGYAEAMPMDQLMEKAKEYLSASNYANYCWLLDVYLDEGEEIGCTVDITGLNYNLTRIDNPESEDSFYYVPGITLTGNACYYGKETGKIYYESGDMTLLILNGVDGSRLGK